MMQISKSKQVPITTFEMKAFIFPTTRFSVEKTLDLPGELVE